MRRIEGIKIVMTITLILAVIWFILTIVICKDLTKLQKENKQLQIEIEQDIKRCKELIKPEHANWIGISNQIAIGNILAERKQDKKKIDKLEKINKILKEMYDDCCICLVESIEKEKVKDKIDKYIEQRLVELAKTGGYILDEGTPQQERLNGMQKGAKDIKKILLEDKWYV